MTDKYFCRGSVGKFTEVVGVLAVIGFEYVVFSHLERPLTLNNHQSKNISVNCLTFVKKKLRSPSDTKRTPLRQRVGY